MTEEIAYVAATTGDLRSALEGQADEALLEHGGELLRALACGGPAKAMSDYPDGGAAMAAFFRHMGSRELTPKRVQCLAYLERYLAEWAQDHSLISETERRSLLASVTRVLSRPACARVVLCLLASERILDVTLGLSLAERFEIDADSKTTPEIYAQVQKRVSRNNVHAAFDRLLTGADSAVITGQL